MKEITKDEVILQLANLASGIERTQNDTHKTKALREAIRLIDESYKQGRWLKVLKRNLQEANAYIGDVQSLVSDSQGVAGYHLNGDIALWSEFDFLFKDGE